MSSPFSIFRKNQKLMLAFFGVILMFVFTVGTVLTQYGVEPGREDELAVSWDGGELTRNRLDMAHDMRGVVAQFLQRAQLQALGRGAFPDQSMQALQNYYRIGRATPLPVETVIDEQTVERYGYEGTVRSFVLAQEASNLGFVVTDNQITDYLLRLVDKKLTGRELAEMITGPTGRFTEKSFYDVLRREMLAERLVQEVVRTGAAMPPAQEFDYYVRLFRQVSLEALEIPVEQFADQVREPTEDELTAYFDKYKTALPPKEFIGNVTLDSPDPGFKLPHRISIEYIKGVADSFIDEVRDEVTEADILAYYDEKKLLDQQLHEDDLPLPELDDFGPADPETGADSPPATTEETPKSKDTPGTGDAPATSDATDSEDKPQPKDTPDGDGKPESNDASAAPEPAVADPGEPSQADEEDCQDAGGSEDEDAAQPVPAETDAAETDPAETDAARPEPTDTEPADTEPADSEPADSEPADSEPADSEPADSEPADKEPAETEPTETKTPSEETTADEDEPDGAKTSDSTDSRKKEIKFKPLDEVRDYIRGRLIEQRAADRLQQRLAEIRARMENYHTARVQAEVGQEPPPPNLKSLGGQSEFEYFEQDLLSREQFDETTDIGKSYRVIPQADDGAPQQVEFETAAFQKGEQSLYWPYQTQDDDGYHYVYWKTAEADEEVPELDKTTRQRVVKAWKLGAGVEDASKHARGLALARAKELADQLRSGATFEQLADQQPGSTVVNTGMFSWLTFGQLNQVDGIDQAGDDFMRAVFQLAPGEVAVAMNHPETFAYVAQVKAENKTPETLQQNYLEEMASPMIQYQLNAAQQMDQMLAHQRWFEELERKLNVKWEKPELRDVR